MSLGVVLCVPSNKDKSVTSIACFVWKWSSIYISMERSIYYGQVIHMQFLNTFFHAHLTRLFIARMTHSGLPWPADLYIGQTQPLHSKFFV